MSYVDLHLHSNCSDGSDAPERVVERAAELGIAAIALTDHDTVDGVGRASEAAERYGMGFLAGVEISAHFDKHELHILGLGVDPICESLVTALAEQQRQRDGRVDRFAERLKALGVELDIEAVRRMAGDGSVGRMHIAKALAESGQAHDPQDAFNRYLNPGKPGFVPKATIAAVDAIEKIKDAGGLAFIAHPGLKKWYRQALPALLELPFDGLEAYHISHTPGETEQFIRLAQNREILITGGSDCHGDIKGQPEMGKVQTPAKYFEAIQAALGHS